MKPEELVSNERLEEIIRKVIGNLDLQDARTKAVACLAASLAARAALEELGIVMVQDCTVSLEKCPLREGGKCVCKLTEGAVLVRMKGA